MLTYIVGYQYLWKKIFRGDELKAPIFGYILGMIMAIDVIIVITVITGLGK